MTEKSFIKKVVLTQAQFNARQTAGTLEEGVEYEISDYRVAISDLVSTVQASLALADTAYQKPNTGIPSTDMTSEVQSSLLKADSSSSVSVSASGTSTDEVGYITIDGVEKKLSGGGGGGGGGSFYEHLIFVSANPQISSRPSASIVFIILNRSSAAITASTLFSSMTAGTYYIATGGSLRSGSAYMSNATYVYKDGTALKIATAFQGSSSEGISTGVFTASSIASVYDAVKEI